jgi:hypothetical protein
MSQGPGKMPGYRSIYKFDLLYCPYSVLSQGVFMKIYEHQRVRNEIMQKGGRRSRFVKSEIHGNT